MWLCIRRAWPACPILRNRLLPGATDRLAENGGTPDEIAAAPTEMAVRNAAVSVAHPGGS